VCKNPNTTLKPLFTLLCSSKTLNAALSSRDYIALRDIMKKSDQDPILNRENSFSFIPPANCPSLKTYSYPKKVTRKRRESLVSFITGYCKMGHTKLILRTVESLARRGVFVPTACTFYPILSSLTREKSFDHAWRVVDLMAEFGIGLDFVGHNLFLKAYCYAGDFDAAAGVLRRMKEESIAADSRTLDELVLGACRAGKVDGAMVILRSFVGKDKLLDAQLLGVLAMNLKKGEEVMSILEEMKQKGESFIE